MNSNTLLIVGGGTGGHISPGVALYEEFVAAYDAALSQIPHGARRIGAIRDGLADFYVAVGLTDAATALFERRHQEDQGDVAVALSLRASVTRRPGARAVAGLGGPRSW